MWPFDRPHQEIVRLGRYTVERWIRTGRQLTRVASHALPGTFPPSTVDLHEAFVHLFAVPAAGKVVLLMESAWMPVLLIDTRATDWSQSQIESLIRHRLSLLFEEGASAEAWAVRIDHRPGERVALGYAMTSGTKDRLLELARKLGFAWDGLQPALTWGLRQANAHAGSGWRAWPEQDRMLLLLTRGGRAVALNAATSSADSSAAVCELVEIERLRCGIADHALPIVAASWRPVEELPASNAEVAWRSIIGSSTARGGQSAPTAEVAQAS